LEELDCSSVDGFYLMVNEIFISGRSVLNNHEFILSSTEFGKRKEYSIYSYEKGFLEKINCFQVRVIEEGYYKGKCKFKDIPEMRDYGIYLFNSLARILFLITTVPFLIILNNYLSSCSELNPNDDFKYCYGENCTVFSYEDDFVYESVKTPFGNLNCPSRDSFSDNLHWISIIFIIFIFYLLYREFSLVLESSLDTILIVENNSLNMDHPTIMKIKENCFFKCIRNCYSNIENADYLILKVISKKENEKMPHEGGCYQDTIRQILNVMSSKSKTNCSLYFIRDGERQLEYNNTNSESSCSDFEFYYDSDGRFFQSKLIDLPYNKLSAIPPIRVHCDRDPFDYKKARQEQKKIKSSIKK